MGDPVGDLVQDLIGDLLNGGGHSVLGVNRTDNGGPAFITAFILNANALDVGNSDEVLPHLFVQTALIELFAQDRIGFTQSFQTVTGNGTQTADTQTGAGKG